MSEQLVTCLLCGQENFSARGLRAHWCDKAPGIPEGKKTRILTREEWEKAVLRSTQGPFAHKMFYGRIVQLCGYRERIEAVREMPIGNLKLVIAWPEIEKTVRAAAERRLRGLQMNHPMSRPAAAGHIA